jgi:hypothetical protein
MVQRPACAQQTLHSSKFASSFSESTRTAVGEIFYRAIVVASGGEFSDPVGAEGIDASRDRSKRGSHVPTERRVDVTRRLNRLGFVREVLKRQARVNGEITTGKTEVRDAQYSAPSCGQHSLPVGAVT